MNRILIHLACPGCEAQCESQRFLHKVRTEAESIKAASEATIEFGVPSLSSLTENGDRTVRLWSRFDFADADVADDLATYAVGELRKMAGKLNSAADAIEGATGNEVRL